MTRLRALPDPDHLPALDPAYLSNRPALGLGLNDHPPRILLLYGSLRDRSFSRLCVEEAARLLRFMGCETRIFDPSDLPLTDQVDYDDHPAVHELREHALWSEGMAWSSPERHGQISGIMKLQIDHLPLNMGGMRPTQGRTLAVMQVSGGSPRCRVRARDGPPGQARRYRRQAPASGLGSAGSAWRDNQPLL